MIRPRISQEPMPIAAQRMADGAKMEIPAVIDADTMQAQAEARIRGNVA